MAITRGATVTTGVDSATPIIATLAHTVNASTTLLVVTFHCEGDLGISSVNWNTTEAMTEISSVVTSSAGGDCRVYAFGRVNPTVTAANVTWTVSGAGDNLAVVCVNYLGTETASVAAATNAIDSENNGDAAATTVAMSGATTLGATLVAAGTFYGGDGNPSSDTGASFNTVREGETGTSTTTDTCYYYGDLIDGGTGGTVSPVINWTGTASDECVGVFFEILSATTNVTPGSGTVRTVGNQPTVSVTNNVVIAALVGTLLFVGQQPTVSSPQPVTVAPTSGTLLVSGNQPTVASKGWVVEVASAAAPTLATPDILSLVEFVEAPGSGTLRVSGNQPTITVVDPKVVTPTVGTVRTVGQQPTVTASDHKTVAPTVGTVLLVGQQPTVTTQSGVTVTPAVGTVRTIGQQPTVTKTEHQAVTPSVGTVLLVGQQPSVAATDHKTATPSVGTVRTIGQQPTVTATAHQTVVPSVGTVLLVGQQPVIQVSASGSVQPFAGTLRVIGQQPTVTRTDHQTVTPTVGTVLLVGQQPTVTVDASVAVSPLSGTVRLVGQAPTVSGVVTQTPSGGWVESAYEKKYARLTDEIRRELEEEQEREELANRLEKVLVDEGTLTQAQADLIRLRGLAEQYSRDDLPNRARRALAFAERAKSDLSLKLALREIHRLQEEEELAVFLLMTLD